MQPTGAPSRARRSWSKTLGRQCSPMAYWIIGAVVLGIAALAVACGRRGSLPAQPLSTGVDSVFVFVRVPESIQPLDRASKYEDPLQVALEEAKLGEVTGGGSQMSAPKADGSSDIEWVGIDVELVSLDQGLGFLKQQLIRLGVPKGTVLEYERAGKQVEEVVH
jgi:hypothetical protein